FTSHRQTFFRAKTTTTSSANLLGERAIAVRESRGPNGPAQCRAPWGGSLMKTPSASLTPLFLFAFLLAQSPAADAEETAVTTAARDPGGRAGSVGAGSPLSTLSGAQQTFFEDGLDRFIEVDSVDGSQPDAPGHGLGPGYNATGCGACHSQ